MSSHVILLGGVGWNNVTKRFQGAIERVPVTQIDLKDYPGDIFQVNGDENKRFEPVGRAARGERVLVEDVAFLAASRTRSTPEGR